MPRPPRPLLLVLLALFLPWCLYAPWQLTTQQARVVELLLDAYLNRSPDLSQAYILEELDVPGSALRFVFRGSDAWTDLVVSGGTNGTFRLEI